MMAFFYRPQKGSIHPHNINYFSSFLTNSFNTLHLNALFCEATSSEFPSKDSVLFLQIIAHYILERGQLMRQLALGILLLKYRLAARVGEL